MIELQMGKLGIFNQGPRCSAIQTCSINITPKPERSNNYNIFNNLNNPCPRCCNNTIVNRKFCPYDIFFTEEGSSDYMNNLEEGSKQNINNFQFKSNLNYIGKTIQKDEFCLEDIVSDVNKINGEDNHHNNTSLKKISEIKTDSKKRYYKDNIKEKDLNKKHKQMTYSTNTGSKTD